MGIRDLFKKDRKGTAPTVGEQPNEQPLTLKYSSGDIAQVQFGEELVELEGFEGKKLQRCCITYTKPSGEFSQKVVYLDPIMGQDQNGDIVNNTKQVYTNMSSTKLGLVKGFFQSTQVKNLPTDYIGHIGYNEDGTPNRSYDNDFYRMYKPYYLQREREQKEAEAQKRAERDEAFLSDLREQVNNTPPHIKTSHAEVLTPEKSPYERN